jgi:hypothetical protein
MEDRDPGLQVDQSVTMSVVPVKVTLSICVSTGHRGGDGNDGHHNDHGNDHQHLFGHYHFSPLLQ